MVRVLAVTIVLGLLMTAGCVRTHYAFQYSSDGDYGTGVLKEQYLGLQPPPFGP